MLTQYTIYACIEEKSITNVVDVLYNVVVVAIHPIIAQLPSSRHVLVRLEVTVLVLVRFGSAGNMQRFSWSVVW